MSSDMVRLGDLYDPVAGVLPSGVLVTDELSSTRQPFNNLAEYKWNDTNFVFNNMGQKWTPDIRPTFFGPDAYGGVKNCGTPRRFTISGAGLVNNFYGHVIEFEILFTGTKLSMAHINLGGNNTGGQYGGHSQIYIEHGGQMWKAAWPPKSTTQTDGYQTYRNLVFAEPQQNIKIRFVMASLGFMSIATEASSIVAPAPNRYSMPLDGDSYTESTAALTTDNVTQWWTCGIADFLFEGSGFCIPRYGQGATGWFSNGAGQVFDDSIGTGTGFAFIFPVTITGFSRYFSESRWGWMTDSLGGADDLGKPPWVNFPGETFGGPLGTRPLASIILGTWNDEASGGVTYEQMYGRVKDCYETFHEFDPYAKLINVSPEPFDDGLFGDAIGPPAHGSKGDTHRLAQMAAASECEWVHYVNAYGPDDPWWTGMGPAIDGEFNVPTNSQQAQLVSPHDGIHGKMEMNRYMAAKILDAIADIEIPAERVNGLV